MSGTDWFLQAKDSAGPSVGPFPSSNPADVACFKLENDKWKKINFEIFLRYTLKSLIDSDYVLKVDDVYFCANDTTYLKLNNKIRRWFWDIFPFAHVGAFNYSIQDMIGISLACKILGATIEKGTDYGIRDKASSIYRSIV